jgi:hypothetical protein
VRTVGVVAQYLANLPDSSIQSHIKVNECVSGPQLLLKLLARVTTRPALAVQTVRSEKLDLHCLWMGPSSRSFIQGRSYPGSFAGYQRSAHLNTPHDSYIFPTQAEVMFDEFTRS